MQFEARRLNLILLLHFSSVHTWFVVHKIAEYTELEGIYEDHQSPTRGPSAQEPPCVHERIVQRLHDHCPGSLFQCLTTLRGKTSFQYPAKTSSLDSFSSDFKFSLWYVRHSLLLCLVQHIYLWWLKVFAEVNLKYLKHWGVAVGSFLEPFFSLIKLHNMLRVQ